MIYHQKQDGQWTRTWFKSLVSVKRWATRNGHAWQVVEDGVSVSCADGTIHRYSTSPASPAASLALGHIAASPAPVREVP